VLFITALRMPPDCPAAGNSNIERSISGPRGYFPFIYEIIFPVPVALTTIYALGVWTSRWSPARLEVQVQVRVICPCVSSTVSGLSWLGHLVQDLSRVTQESLALEPLPRPVVAGVLCLVLCIFCETEECGITSTKQ
jgi:hypothetical protein